ncbi:penicillin-binding protein, beta-lactamase class C [Chthonomonas calidirosea]|uniref:serine hydrolase domain-containing protein n=1 Tax=Chthonomonas calidirosea TaxID=454171 RepID=UPI0006DD554A|nr:serine hydrolase domain-containing protein [Chthonomonas calidirosea]CEK16458.1 penicillin-binding protein, beta-lactamase class C [Chthonomonas calidirosea]
MNQTIMAVSPPSSLNSLLTPIQTQYNLPALAGCIVTSKGLIAVGAVGMRKFGSDVPVTLNDPFHLGSDTKAMTAFLVALLVEQGKLQWDTPLSKALPQLAAQMQPDYRRVTIRMLLEHRSGFSAESWPPGQTFQSLHHLPGTPMKQRLAYARMILADPPVNPPDTTFLYSNRNYALLGVILEQLTHTPWEKLITDKLFHPLHMTTAGFGAMGTVGKIDAPWQHVFGPDGKPDPIPPGPLSDNPDVIAPAGKVHCSVEDWAKFIQCVLRGMEGRNGLLQATTLQRLLAPSPGSNYAGGWLITDRPWGGGRVYTHAGSNTMNFCVAWVAPKRDFAVLIATNIGGDRAAEACDAAASTLIRFYLGSPTAPK